MKIFDISRELISAPTFPGDTPPTLKTVSDMKKGANFNLSDINMCLHNGTHIDAPKHFDSNKRDIERMGISVFCGVCDVVTFDGDITGEDVFVKVPIGCERLIIRTNGKGHLTYYALMDLLSKRLKLIGIDDVTIGTAGNDEQIHKELLRNDIAILEGLDLNGVPDGKYVIVCEPLKIRGAEAAPCRAILMKDIMLY